MRKGIIFCLSLCVLFNPFAAHAQVIASFTVTNVDNAIATPVCVDIGQLTSAADSTLVLREVKGGKEIPFQVEHGYHRFLWWLVKQEPSRKTTTRVFELSMDKRPRQADPAVKVSDENGALLITANKKKVLQYNYQVQYPPKGVDTFFKRSGFIHPLWSPSGNVLTQINPPDHYHHMGIWNPWTDVVYQGKKVDFWNLGDKKGTVRFAHFISKDMGDVFGGFKALQEHVVLNTPAGGGETIAMNEVWDVKVFNVGPATWLWDFTSTLNCAATDTVFLKEYRYGGFGFRATADWNSQNSRVLTSEGKARKEADASRARWCMIDGDMQKGHSGILFMGSPSNYNFPEPMRVWPEDMNKRGDVFFSFSPTRNTDWTLVPGNNYVLKYRMLVYEDTLSPARAEEVWKDFAHPPTVIISKR